MLTAPPDVAIQFKKVQFLRYTFVFEKVALIEPTLESLKMTFVALIIELERSEMERPTKVKFLKVIELSAINPT